MSHRFQKSRNFAVQLCGHTRREGRLSNGHNICSGLKTVRVESVAWAAVAAQHAAQIAKIGTNCQ